MRGPIHCAWLVMALCLLWIANPTPAVAQGGFHDLHCDNAVNPRGLKTQHPVLSWELGPNVMQRAYQILAASSEEKLAAGEADLWDSGRVITDKKTAEYQGKPLTSLEHCYWKVRVWETFYQASGYSEPASWQMGVLFFGPPERK